MVIVVVTVVAVVLPNTVALVILTDPSDETVVADT